MTEGKQVLDRFFEDVRQLEPNDQILVWHILTALRGPDFDFWCALAVGVQFTHSSYIDEAWTRGDSLKDSTTRYIRGLVCNSLARTAGAFSVVPNKYSAKEFVKAIRDELPTDHHFIAHVNFAYRALKAFGYLDDLED
jgi:hypothetical protein